MRAQQYLVVGLLLLLSSLSRGASEKELIGVLRSDAPLQQKARACQLLARVGGRDSVPVLAALLGDKDLGDYARFGLQPINDPGVDDALRDALGTLEGRHLIGVVNSIGVRCDAKAVSNLQKLVSDPGKGAVSEALMALGMIATGDAIAAIRSALADGSPALSAAAADAALVAAERLLSRERSDEAIVLYDAICRANLPAHIRAAATYGAIVSRGEVGVPMLVAALKSKDADRVGVALRAARDLSGSAISGALLAQLETTSPAVQARLIGVLVERGDAGARRGVEALVDSHDSVVRLAALQALGEIGDANSVGTLLKALGDEGANAAAGSLRTLEGGGVDSAILAGLGGTAGKSRVELIGVLADRRYVNATPALLRETAHEDERIAAAAFKALGALAGPDDVPAMIKSLLATKSPTVVRKAESAVINVAGVHAGAVIAALDSATSTAARVSLLRVLGRMGGEAGCAAVREASEDTDSVVKNAAVRALVSWPDSHAVDALMEIIKQTKDETHRVLALRGYVRLLGLDAATKPGMVASRLSEAMALTKTADMRKAILGALSNVPHRDALELAMSHIDDEALRAEAGLAAVTIARAVMGTENESVRDAAKRLVASPNKRIAKEARGILGQLDRFADAIIAWRISGPYMQKGKKYDALFDIVFEPEKPNAKNVKWQPIAAGTHPKYPQVLDLRKALDGDQRAAYALTWVYSEKRQPLRLEMGSDDGIKAWLNGELVHANNTARAAIPYTDKVNVLLNKGWNPLLLKVTQNQIPWEFCARICARDGKPVSGIRIDPNHEGEWRLPEAAPKRAASST